VRFRDRHHAGRLLADRLLADPLAARGVISGDGIVLALPRGGVPVGAEVADALQLPLDVVVVRKLGVPGHEELAMGAVARAAGARSEVRNDDVIRALGIDDDVIARVAEREWALVEAREREYRGDRPAEEIEGRSVVLVDDGLATGSTMKAAITAVRAHAPRQVIVAVPTGAPETVAELAALADTAVAVSTPAPFHAVGLWYDDFSPTSDEEVRDLLSVSARTRPSG
jgi:predicted phosphoribosyltransferase